MLATMTSNVQGCVGSAAVQAHAAPGFAADSVVALHRAFLGTPEIFAILAVVVLLFGASKLPQLGKGLGEAIGNFKRAKKEGEEQAQRPEVDATPRIDAQPVQKLDGSASSQVDAAHR